MKLKSEAKIGIIVITTIILVIWGINFLKGKNVIKRSDVFYAVYSDISGLEESAAISLNGYKVGMVNDISFKENELSSLVVALAIENDFNIPEGSVAELYSSILGTTSVRIIPSGSSKYYSYGDTLPSRVEESLFSQVQNEIDPLKIRIEKILNGVDSFLISMNKVLDEKGIENMKSGFTSLNRISKDLEKQLSPGGDLDKTFSELRKLSETLAQNRTKLDTIFSNVEAMSDSIARSNLRQTINNLNESLAEASLFIHNINNGEGSLGLLSTNDSLYVNLQTTINSLNTLLQDVNEHPKKYVHFSLFAKKDKIEQN